MSYLLDQKMDVYVDGIEFNCVFNYRTASKEQYNKEGILISPATDGEIELQEVFHHGDDLIGLIDEDCFDAICEYIEENFHV